MITKLEIIHLESGSQPVTRAEIDHHIDRERRYRRHLMTHEHNPAARRVKIAASTSRSDALQKRKDRTP